MNMTEKSVNKKIRTIISRNVRRLRIDKKMSQLELADKADLSYTFINEIENCKKNISVKTHVKLCIALNAEPEEFYFSEEAVNDQTRQHMNYVRETVLKAVTEITDPYLNPSQK